MDMHTRVVVLENSLILEDNVKNLVKFFFNIYGEKVKTLSNKSGRLSFKSQIDLLFDLEVLNKDEYQKCLLIMELRNQFMHNIDCNTFKEAINILENENQLLKYSENGRVLLSQKKIRKKKIEIELKEIELKEIELKSAFLSLVIEVSKLITTKFNNRLNLFNENKAFINELCLDVVKGYQMHIDFFNLILPELKPNSKDGVELVKFKADLKQKINNPTERKKIVSDLEDKIHSTYKSQVWQRLYKSV